MRQTFNLFISVCRRSVLVLFFSMYMVVPSFIRQTRTSGRVSNIQGNEYADQMAKEAAEEAKEMTELPPIVRMGDVKAAARESGKMKWQEMWDKTEKGRHLFNYRNKVGLNLEHKYQSTKGEISIIQLRTGNVKLNEYLQKTNIVESNKCQCSHIESIGHYLLECPYMKIREKN